MFRPLDSDYSVVSMLSSLLVERRRRDRINTWIAELYKLLPPEQQAKSQYQSKGVVLKRVCEYFQNYDATLKAVSFCQGSILLLNLIGGSI